MKQLFEGVAESVLLLANLVKEPFVPGLIVSVLVLALGVVMIRLWRWSHEYLKVLAKVRELITGGVKDSQRVESNNLEAVFFLRQPEITHQLREMGNSKSKPAIRISSAWREYRETLKVDDHTEVMLNGIRPSVFFNTEDLGVEARGWRIIPALFVSFGLTATFLGLIAALQQTGVSLDNSTVSPASGAAGTDGTASALKSLLDIASAKFIMSLTGLFCSIVLTIFLRLRLSAVEHAIDELCMDIEKRVEFLSLESLAYDQKRLLEEQKEHAQKMNTELIAGIGRSLNDELPKAISASISDVMAPVMNQVGQAGAQGVKDMVGDLANQFSGDVARAIGNAADRFDDAALKIEGLADALRKSTGDANGNMEKTLADLRGTMSDMRDGLIAGANESRSVFESGSADVVQRMNESLDGIRTAMVEANEEQRKSAGAMSAAASRFSEQIDEAGQAASRDASKQFEDLKGSVSNDLNEALKPMLETAKQLSDETRQQIVAPIHDLTSTLEGFVVRLEQGTNRFGEYSTALTSGSDAAGRHAGILSEASASLLSAAEPVSALARGLSTSAHATADAATQIAGALQDNRDIMNSSMQALGASLQQFQGVIERYDQLDEKLGVAFTQFRQEVDSTIQHLTDYSGNVHNTYADALSKLSAVVDQARDFQPTMRS